MPYLELNNISKKYGNTLALDRVNLYVEKGEFVCILGPSGCGKSTIMRDLAGLENIEAGIVAVSYPHLRATETEVECECRTLLENK